MKKVFQISLMICYLVSSFGQSEQENDTIKLSINDLEVPNSPAFVLLDEAPSSIERPNSSKAFVLNILNSVAENNGLPENYAFEITPFWFFKKSNINALKFMGIKVDSTGEYKSSNIFNGLKIGSISFAHTTSKDSITNESINNISVGIRSNIITIRSKKQKERIVSEYNSIRITLKEFEAQLLESDIMPIDTQGNINPNYKKLVQEFLEEKEDKISNKLPNKLNERPLFAVDVAAAYNTFFINRKFSERNFGRLGVWATLNASFILNDKKTNNYFNLYVLGRYLRDGKTIINDTYIKQNFYDFGGKAEFEFKKFSLSYEYIYRKTETENTYRSNGVLKYKISDKLYLTGSYGKNFGDTNNLISLLGINWGFATGKEKLSTN